MKKKKIKPNKWKQAGIGEIGGIKDDEGGIGDDVEVDGDEVGEASSGEVIWGVCRRVSEQRILARLPFELLHRLKQKQR